MVMLLVDYYPEITNNGDCDRGCRVSSWGPLFNLNVTETEEATEAGSKCVDQVMAVIRLLFERLRNRIVLRYEGAPCMHRMVKVVCRPRRAGEFNLRKVSRRNKQANLI